MQKISNISFKGIEQKPLDTTPSVSVPIETQELGEKALPMGDKSLAIDPVLPNEFLGEADLKRYKKVQLAWAESLSKRTGIPIENILARLPEVQFGDAKSMLQLRALGCFAGYNNNLSIIPIKELANSLGSDESKVVHESVHGYFYNLLRAHTHGLNEEQINGIAAKAVFDKILKGEQEPIIQDFQTINTNGQDVSMPVFSTSPALSKKEIEAFEDNICLLKMEHFHPESGQLNDQGASLIREKLIPKLTQYSKYFEGTPSEKENSMVKSMVDYTNSFFNRRNFLRNIITKSDSDIDLEVNIGKKLTEKEIAYVESVMNGLLSTSEGNFLRSISAQMDPNDILGISSKSYFLSFEEMFARKEESIYRHQKINREIAQRTKQGLKPLEAQLKEQRTVKSNLRLLHLAQKLDTVEKEMVLADKKPELMIQRHKHMQEFEVLHAKIREKTERLRSYINQEELSKLTTEQDLANYIEKKFPVELRIDATELFRENAKLFILGQTKPKFLVEDLLAQIPENIKIVTQRKALMDEIRQFAPKCDLLGIPKEFYSSKEEFVKALVEVQKLVEKWGQRIRV